MMGWRRENILEVYDMRKVEGGWDEKRIRKQKETLQMFSCLYLISHSHQLLTFRLGLIERRTRYSVWLNAKGGSGGRGGF